MKILQKFVYTFSLGLILILNGCSDTPPPENQYRVSSENPAIGLTFGWYVPDSLLQDLIGPIYTPKIYNDKNEGVLMFFVARGDNYQIGGKNSGNFDVAHLAVPVESVSGVKQDAEKEIEGTIVCPLTILDDGRALHGKLDELGFAMVPGEIDFSVEETDEMISAEIIVTTTIGENVIRATFEKLPVDFNAVTAIINPSSTDLKYFYGPESALIFKNGSGSITSEGVTFYSGLKLESREFYINYFKDFTWEFYFEGN